VPGTGTLAGKYLPRYIACRATITATTSDATIMEFGPEDLRFLQTDHEAIQEQVQGAGQERLRQANQYKGPAVPNWIAVKNECLASVDNVTTVDEDVFMKPCRKGVKIITLREEFGDDSLPKTVLVRSPAANRAKNVSVKMLVGLAVDIIYTIKYRVVLNLDDKTCVVRQDLHLHSVYEKEPTASVEDDDRAIAGFEHASDYEDQLAAAFETPERGTQRTRDD
jgi:hypothetical protein